VPSVFAESVHPWPWNGRRTQLTFAANSRLSVIDKSVFAVAKYSEIEIPASVERIEAKAFTDCTALPDIHFEANSRLMVIGRAAFANCGCEDLTLPAGIRFLAVGTFAESQLQRLVIPASLEAIGPSCFGNCQDLRHVGFELNS
jgi:hypothetical protein